jgi:RecA-family ATPase
MSTPAGPALPDFRLETLEEMRTQPSPSSEWLWEGYLRRGNVTLLTSQWKLGKTTLVSVLLSKLSGGGTFLDLPLRPGRAAVISEESTAHWLERGEKVPLGPHIRCLCRPFRGRPQPADWAAMVEFLLRTRREAGLELVVIDPLATFLPGRTENDAATMLEMLLPLQQLTAEGLSVLVLHHPKKGEASPGQAARGSGALTGYVDIIVEMNWHGMPHSDDRRRRLTGFSRHQQTPRRKLIELNAEGTDYLVHGDFQADDFVRDWPVLLGVLEDAERKLTRKQILEDWPADFPKPAPITLWNWLDRCVKERLVLRDGTGRRHSPFRYWLPGQEAKWAADPYRLADLPELGPIGR